MNSAPALSPNQPDSTYKIPPPPKAVTSKKDRRRKGEYLKKLEEENSFLKKQIMDLTQNISTKEAQNAALMQQIQFFKSCMPAQQNQTSADSQIQQPPNAL